VQASHPTRSLKLKSRHAVCMATYSPMPATRSIPPAPVTTIAPAPVTVIPQVPVNVSAVQAAPSTLAVVASPSYSAPLNLSPSTTQMPLPVSSVMTCDQFVSSTVPIGLPAITLPAAPGEVNAPPKVTSGMPDPEAIAKQRASYLRALEEQEKQAIGVLEQQKKQQIDLLRAKGDQQKRKYCLEVNQQVAQNDIVLDQQRSEQLMTLNQQYSQQRGILENQANTLIMEYQQKRAQEEMCIQQYKLQVEQYNSQKKYNDEMVRLQNQEQMTEAQLTQAYATSYMPPPLARQSNTFPSTISQLNVQPLTPSLVV